MDKDKSNVAITAPCPFCGATPRDHDQMLNGKVSPLLAVDEADIDTAMPIKFVFCGECGARGPYVFSGTLAADNEDPPEQLWNNRAETPQAAKIKKLIEDGELVITDPATRALLLDILQVLRRK